MAPLKVLISGGGVGGTALAFWLSKLAPSVISSITVIEHFPTLRTTGLQIDLRGPGVEVLRRMGLEQAFREKVREPELAACSTGQCFCQFYANEPNHLQAAPEEGMQFIDRHGRSRAFLAAHKDGRANQGITSEFEIMRGDLCRLIYDATSKSRCKYVFGTSITHFEESKSGDGVDVAFSNGSSETFDLLVGADGISSRTRRMLFGQDDKAFRSIKEAIAYLTIPKSIEEGERYVGQMFPATAQRSILVRRHRPDMIQLYLILSREDKRLKAVKRADIPAEKKAFTEIFRDAGWRSRELLEAMQDADDFYCERLGVVKLPAWYKGHVALLGDAGFGSGGSGSGTSCAMIGAYVLAGEIGKHFGKDAQPQDALPSALKSYDASFRPYMDKIQAGLDSPVKQWLTPSGDWAIAVLHWCLEAIVYLRIADFAALVMNSEANEKWPLPKYKELQFDMVGEEKKS